MERRAFRAMGTDVELLLDVPSSVESFLVLASAERELERLEALLSRFREDSELSTLNRVGRAPCRAGPLEVTQLALEARARTGGRFDPTVHDALVAAGYDRSFEHVEGSRRRRRQRPPVAAAASRRHGDAASSSSSPARISTSAASRRVTPSTGVRPARPAGPLPGRRRRRHRHPRAGLAGWRRDTRTACSRSSSRTARSPPRASTGAAGRRRRRSPPPDRPRDRRARPKAISSRVTVVAATAQPTQRCLRNRSSSPGHACRGEADELGTPAVSSRAEADDARGRPA